MLIFLIFVILFASIVSLGSQFWFLPIFGAAISLYGLASLNKKPVDYGHLLIIFTFFLVNRNIEFNLPNMMLIIGFFFLFFASWNLFRRNIFLGSIDERSKRKRSTRTEKISRDELVEEEDNTTVFKKDTFLAMLNFIFMGVLVTFTGALVSIYGLVGIDFPDDYQEPLFIFFGVLTLSMAYVIIKILPHHINKKGR